MEIAIKNLDKVDFNSPEIVREFEELEIQHKLLLKSTIPDVEVMNKTFTI